MQPLQAMKSLGATRVIWVDDRFAEDSAEQLAELLYTHLETSRACGFSDLEPLFDRLENDDGDARVELIEKLLDLTQVERNDIKKKFYEQESALAFKTEDLSDPQIESVCCHLNIALEDRWSFERAQQQIPELCKSGDAHVSYIIDLNDAYRAQDNNRGLDLLALLHSSGSEATSFLLTHAADVTSEATKESQLRDELTGENGAPPFPICVIAKQRLEGEPTDQTVCDALRVAIKRAGLRRSIHEVLIKAQEDVSSAFTQAKNALLEVPPEQLDEYAINRAHMEGISELHVVERALTATISESLRKLFATDVGALESIQRVRALHEVSLDLRPSEPHDALEDFRKKELWEPSDLVNRSLAPLACGDVFEFLAIDGVEHKNRFILLVQPCDVMMRPKGDRGTELGFFVPLKLSNGEEVNNHSLKQPPLPFLLEGQQWICDFRKGTSINLSILDLATLREDGHVSYDVEQELPARLLPGQAKSAKKTVGRLKAAVQLMEQQKGQSRNNQYVDLRCQLALSNKGPFAKIAHATYVPMLVGSSGESDKIPACLTWNIRRAGRVRMPYAAALLSHYLSVMSREAFELDYLRANRLDEPNVAAPTPETVAMEVAGSESQVEEKECQRA